MPKRGSRNFENYILAKLFLGILCEKHCYANLKYIKENSVCHFLNLFTLLKMFGKVKT